MQRGGTRADGGRAGRPGRLVIDRPRTEVATPIRIFPRTRAALIGAGLAALVPRLDRARTVVVLTRGGRAPGS